MFNQKARGRYSWDRKAGREITGKRPSLSSDGVFWDAVALDTQVRVPEENLLLRALGRTRPRGQTRNQCLWICFQLSWSLCTPKTSLGKYSPTVRGEHFLNLPWAHLPFRWGEHLKPGVLPCPETFYSFHVLLCQGSW